MTEKEHFILLAQTGRFTITDLCADFGISRKTGYKYLQRYETEGRVRKWVRKWEVRKWGQTQNIKI
ncbi:MAG: helix-turn-helix domain-containing protein [Opitutaceae bacterium]